MHSGALVFKIRRPQTGSPAADRVLTAFSSFEAGNDHWDAAFIAFDPNVRVAMHRVAAVNRLFNFGEVQAGDGIIYDDGDSNNDDDDDVTMITIPTEADPTVVDRRLQMNLFLRDFVIGRGYPTVLRPLFSETVGHVDDIDLAIHVKSPQINVSADTRAPTTLLPPRVDYIKDGDQCLVTTILAEMDSDTRDRFKRYLDHTVLGMVGVAGFAGSGKTQHLALCALLMLAHPDIKHIYVSAPTHVAVSNVAERIHKIGTKVCQGSAAGVPLVVRGFEINTETKHFMSVIQPQATVCDEWTTSRWEEPLSLCQWLLKVVGAPGYALAKNDRPAIKEISREFATSDEFKDLRLLVAGQDVPDTEDGTPSH